MPARCFCQSLASSARGGRAAAPIVARDHSAMLEQWVESSATAFAIALLLAVALALIGLYLYEQAFVMADEDSPAFVLPNFQTAVGALRSVPDLLHAFRTGNGIGWQEHDHNVFVAVERSFRSGYLENIAANWIPALDGIEEKLAAGIEVADVGCGHGASTIIMASLPPEVQKELESRQAATKSSCGSSS